MYRETIVHYCTVKGSSLPARKLAKNLTDLSTRRLSSYSGQRFLVVVEGFYLVQKNPLPFMQQPSEKPPLHYCTCVYVRMYMRMTIIVFSETGIDCLHVLDIPLTPCSFLPYFSIIPAFLLDALTSFPCFLPHTYAFFDHPSLTFLSQLIISISYVIFTFTPSPPLPLPLPLRPPSPPSSPPSSPTPFLPASPPSLSPTPLCQTSGGLIQPCCI